ncbi:MAG: DUF1501 domain-containing protein [Acidobacteria bacterium]|nr:DUF1501 domain-containing protein [Acidobacteriota bacterium]
MLNLHLRDMTRRHFFQSAAALGLAQAAFAGVHHKPKAKNVIFLFMAGAPSQLDLFDYKPKLNEHDGKPCPAELIKGERFAFIKGVPNLLGTPHRFARHGQSGAEISELMPHLGKVADQVSFIKSVHTTQFNHAPAQIFMNSGHQIPGRPSMGSWLSYGLGSENKNLPAFVVLLSGKNAPDGGKSCWGNGFLPSLHQGVEFRRAGDPVLFLSNPDGVSDESRRRSLDLLRDLNQTRLADIGDPEISSRITNYELAYKMQSSVPELAEIDGEPRHIHDMYGTTPGRNSFANNCLLARRLVERGVRMVELFHRGWDTHGASADEDIVNKLHFLCREVDQGGAALVRDLKQRGLLDTTLVVWGGEFGRTPMNEARGGSKFLGRDHHNRAFTVWVAGGGLKPGLTIGKTDDLGYNIVEEPVSVHDLHATLLHQLGIDHTRLTFRFQGRDFRLTDIHGELIRKLTG